MSSGFGVAATIDHTTDTYAYIQDDYATFLDGGPGAVFTNYTPNVLALCTDCMSNSYMNVTSQRCCDEPANCIPTEIDMARAKSSENVSKETLCRVMLKDLVCSPCCTNILETPTEFIENQPV